MRHTLIDVATNKVVNVIVLSDLVENQEAEREALSNELMGEPVAPERLEEILYRLRELNAAIYTPPEGHKLGPDGGEVGDIWNEKGGAYVVDTTLAKEELLRLASARQQTAVQMGAVVVVGGVPVATDPRGLAAVSHLVLATQLDPNFSTTWKDRAGNFHELDAGGIRALYAGMLAHVQACVAAEAAAVANIQEGHFKTAEDVESAPWPKGA